MLIFSSVTAYTLFIHVIGTAASLVYTTKSCCFFLVRAVASCISEPLLLLRFRRGFNLHVHDYLVKSHLRCIVCLLRMHMILMCAVNGC